MQCRHVVHSLLLATLFLVNPGLCQTPVIGGTCRLGTADVQIGGKQTQFFLKCEATSDSAPGDGVWVVKSRAASGGSINPTSTSSASATLPAENTQPQQHPKLMRKQNAPNIFEQDIDARESDSCAVSATCLQATSDMPSSYLQCDQTSLRWMRKSCQDGFVFNFEQQTCVVPKRMNSLSLLCDVPNASCVDSSDCPPTFTCSNRCCRLNVCPGGVKVSFTCTNAYQCRAGESCLFGGCCRRTRARPAEEVEKPSRRGGEELATVAVNLAVDSDPYSALGQPFSRHETDNASVPASKRTASPALKAVRMPASAPTDACVPDTRVDGCNLSNPCPEVSECMSGQCCRMEERRCHNGLRALNVPRTCLDAGDCPIASLCENGACCPFEGSLRDQPLKSATLSSTDEHSSQKKHKSESSVKRVDSNSTPRKLKCLANTSCSLAVGRMCPPEYTCTLDGKCCQIGKTCLDGSVPETMCGPMELCPSSMHACYMMDKLTNICCARDAPLAVESLCPPGSYEVNPRFGDLCRYSIQCPSPFFCNSRGRCCQELF